MELVKTKPDSKQGIYAKSEFVSGANKKFAVDMAEEMIRWLDKTNGNFKGQHPACYAIAHCQVTASKNPLRFFVLNKSLVNKDKANDNFYFESQAIFNALILESPDKIKKDVPQRTATKTESGKVEVSMKMEKKMVENKIEVPEGCMSFPYRKAKNMTRYHTIKVEYQYIGMFGQLKTFKGWVSGLKAHIIQHECDHFNAVNIFHNGPGNS